MYRLGSAPRGRSRVEEQIGFERSLCYLLCMSPTVFKWKGYRFFFFSREEERKHVHVTCADGEAKFWLEPDVKLAENSGLSSTEISEALECVKERKDEVLQAWRRHFRS